jgi:hypothetical protein
MTRIVEFRVFFGLVRKNNYVIDIEAGNCLLKYCIKSKMFLFKNLLKIVNQKREIKSLSIKKIT